MTAEKTADTPRCYICFRFLYHSGDDQHLLISCHGINKKGLKTEKLLPENIYICAGCRHALERLSDNWFSLPLGGE